MQESVVRYTAAAVDGENLRLDYTVEVVDARARRHSRERRSASLALADLTGPTEFPVDAFPVRRIPEGSRSGREVPIELVVVQRDGPRASTCCLLGSPVLMEIDEREGRHAGFRLCPTPNDPCEGYFHSASLHRDPIAWWVYPVAPFTVSVDLALFPIQVVTLPVLLVSGD